MSRRLRERAGRLVPSHTTLVLLGVVLVALNLRPAIASVSPVLERIRADLGLGYVAAGLLTTVPTVCMGVFAFVAPSLSARLGRARAIGWATLLVGVGTAARLWGDVVVVLYATSVVVGVGIAITQTLLPGVVSERFPESAGTATGLYTASLIGGSALASAFTVPLVDLLGGWPAALASWALLALIATAVWEAVTRGPAPESGGDSERGGDSGSGPSGRTDSKSSGGTDTGPSSEDVHGHIPWRQPWAWALTLLLVGVVFVYFAELTWLAPYYVALGWSASRAGLLLTVSILGQVVGALSCTWLGDRLGDRRPALAISFAASAVGLAGAAVAPLSAPWVWATVMGFGISGGAAVTFTLPVDYAPDPESVGGLSALVLGVGYLLGGVGPSAVGWLRDLTGGYRVPFLVLAVMSLLMLVASAGFRPDRIVEAE